MKHLSPQISLIIPIYNGQKYVEECLYSITAQSFSDFECIIVDDGSTDETLRILQNFKSKDPRIEIIRINHKGSSFARNIGLEKAHGEFVIFLDSDDIFEPSMLGNSPQLCNQK